MKNSINTNNVLLIGFAEKGPIETPILIKDLDQLKSTLGFPHSDSYLFYTAEQLLSSEENIYIYRVNTKEETANIPVPGMDNIIKIHSKVRGPYIFNTNQFFKWKLNGVLANKPLVVLMTDKDGISAKQLADELNDQLTRRDGIEFYVHDDDFIAVRTTNPLKNELELVSIQNSMCGPWGSIGFGYEMKPAIKVSSKDYVSFSNCEHLFLQIIVSGSGYENIDGKIQIVNLDELDRRKNSVNDIIDYINKVEIPSLPGGWTAFNSEGKLGFKTTFAGKDASIRIRPTKLSTVLGFDTIEATGNSPKNDAIFLGSKNSSDESFLVYADSAGEDGNSTRITIVNDENTFNISVYNKGLLVESWGQLSKNPNDRFYVESFINSFSNWIRIKDNAKNNTSPKSGTYKLISNKNINSLDKSSKNDILLKSIKNIFEKEKISFDIICVPGFFSHEVAECLIAECEKRQDCLAIIDTELGSELDCNLSSSNYGAVFGPWVKATDIYNKTNIWLPPSGVVISNILSSLPYKLIPGILDVFSEETFSSNVNQIIFSKNSRSFMLRTQNVLSGIRINEIKKLINLKKQLNLALNNEEISKKLSEVYGYILKQLDIRVEWIKLEIGKNSASLIFKWMGREFRLNFNI